MGGLGSGGHNRRSVRSKRLAGTARRDRISPILNGLGKTETVAAFTPPAWLGRDALTKWHALAPVLAKHGILTALTEDLLANACMHWEIAVQCYRRITRDGPILKGQRGQAIKHPALQVLRENSAAFRECLARMGMTPVDVGKIDSLVAPEDDEAKAFFGY